jgi:hypothetical protein
MNDLVRKISDMLDEFEDKTNIKEELSFWNPILTLIEEKSGTLPNDQLELDKLLADCLEVDPTDVWLMPANGLYDCEGVVYFMVEGGIIGSVPYITKDARDSSLLIYWDEISFTRDPSEALEHANDMIRFASSLKDKLSPAKGCPKGGDISNNCEGCAYSGDYYYSNGECLARPKTKWARVGMNLQLTDEELQSVLDDEPIDIKGLQNEGRAYFHGDSYFPDIEENEGVKGLDFEATTMND